MSRREGRDSYSKRHRSRFDREPSPKRSRRDGKPEAERVPSGTELDAGNHMDWDQKNRRRLQDALPLESPLTPNSKIEIGSASKESDKKNNGRHEGSKHSSDPTDIPRSRSYFQHDERGNDGQVGRSFGRRSASDREWRELKDQRNSRTASKSAIYDALQRDDKSQAKGDENSVWHHDGFYEMEANAPPPPPPPPPPARKRPAFREKKIPVDSENADKAVSAKPRNSDHPVVGSERREEKDRKSYRLDRPEKPSGGVRVPNRGERQRGDFLARERYGGGSGSYRGRDRYSGQRGYHSSGGTRVEKWKHDLFHEANRSPTPKNEEDQIAKVEALLAS